MSRLKTIIHVAGRPVNGEQRCQRCQAVVVKHDDLAAALGPSCPPRMFLPGNFVGQIVKDTYLYDREAIGSFTLSHDARAEKADEKICSNEMTRTARP